MCPASRWQLVVHTNVWSVLGIMIGSTKTSGPELHQVSTNTFFQKKGMISFEHEGTSSSLLTTHMNVYINNLKAVEITLTVKHLVMEYIPNGTGTGLDWHRQVVLATQKNPAKKLLHKSYGPIPIASMYCIFTFICLICMVNVSQYTIHGSYGNINFSNFGGKTTLYNIGKWRMIQSPAVNPNNRFVGVAPKSEMILACHDLESPFKDALPQTDIFSQT